MCIIKNSYMYITKTGVVTFNNHFKVFQFLNNQNATLGYLLTNQTLTKFETGYLLNNENLKLVI